MTRNIPASLLLTALLLPSAARAQSRADAAIPGAYSQIRQEELKRDLYAMAGPAMRGREAGTLDEMRASMWTADMLRSIGVKPAGTDGSYFQWFNMRRTRVSTVSSLLYVGRPLEIWKEIVPNVNAQSDVRGSTVWAGNGTDSTIDVRGKVAVAMLAPPANPVRKEGTNSYEYRYANAAMQQTAARLQRRGATAVILVADSIAEIAFDGVAAIRSRGAYDVDSVISRNGRMPGDPALAAARPATPAQQAGPQTPPAPVYLVRRALLSSLQRGGDSVHLRVRTEVFQSPSVNIVGKIQGTDPRLRAEYVLYSSHQDHDGVRYTIDGDSVWSGADDNASVSVALFAIARAMVKQPPKRSVLFVYHGAEERGLLGSRYHATNPVVPISSIVAVLNGDMIGRNHPDSATLLGMVAPHRNSNELVDAAMRANALTGKFKLDTTWDMASHPEGWYFRSDHLPYAYRQVPAIEYSTNLHADYHTPRDKPENINYGKLTRMTQWMYLTGWFVANDPARPTIIPGFKLER